jgi:hypothetical protein
MPLNNRQKTERNTKRVHFKLAHYPPLPQILKRGTHPRAAWGETTLRAVDSARFLSVSGLETKRNPFTWVDR